MFISIIEVEYIALGYATRETVCIQCFINKLKLDIMLEIKFFGDNKINITLTKNVESQY